MIEYLNSTDTHWFLFINGMHITFFDPIMYWFSDKWIWVPMYLIIAFYIIKHYKIQGVIMLLFAAVVIALCDQIASHLIKNEVLRLRPSHEPALAGLVHLSKAGPGGMYGFISSHAANAFGLATFLYFILDEHFKLMKYLLFVWAIMVSYSRIYNGVHYPGDVLTAALIGALIGWGTSKLFVLEERKRLKA